MTFGRSWMNLAKLTDQLGIPWSVVMAAHDTPTVPELLDEIERLRWWLQRVTQVDGADDAGSGVWMCALRAQAGLDGKPIKETPST